MDTNLAGEVQLLQAKQHFSAIVESVVIVEKLSRLRDDLLENRHSRSLSDLSGSAEQRIIEQKQGERTLDDWDE